MSKKTKGLSFDEKCKRMLEIFYETVDNDNKGNVARLFPIERVGKDGP
jgi:truncated hemoglobin YjbI